MGSMVVTCHGCGAAFRVPSASQAALVPCPYCQTPVSPASSIRAFPWSKNLIAITFVLAGLIVWTQSDPFNRIQEASLPPVALVEPTHAPTADRLNHCSRDLAPTVSQPAQRISEQPDQPASSMIRLASRETPPRLESVAPVPDDPAKLDQVRPQLPASNGSADSLRPAAPASLVSPLEQKTSSETAKTEPPHYKVRDESGRYVVARRHGSFNDRTVLILPDGQLGIPTKLVPTDEPFRPLTANELRDSLAHGPLQAFHVEQTAHYLIFYQSSEKFAKESGRWLESLYKQLSEFFLASGLPVHQPDFPLIAVIYRTEKDFREGRVMDPEVQAYYEIYTNRIHFYESSDQDLLNPELSALRKPQTVAHEGTHQILQNIGIHPRLASWPIWLVEGLAEFCASPVCARKDGVATWNGLGMVNGLHMATLRELEDPHSLAINAHDAQAKRPMREPGKPLLETMIRKTRLNPTEYALSWAMTHYLFTKRQDDFLSYLRTMGQRGPLQPASPDDEQRAFEEAFGHDLVKIDNAIEAHLRKLAKQKGYPTLPYYSVAFEQMLPAGLIRRATMVSQSPQVIEQWIQDLTSPAGTPPAWQVVPHSTRARALLAAEQWARGY